jgi:transcriptional regulator with XRE-family HTH domain
MITLFHDKVYVASQKKRQIPILQEMAKIYGVDILTKSNIENRDIMDLLDNLSDKTLEQLFDYVINLSFRDLKMYSFLSNENKESSSIFIALIDLEEDFIANIESGYLNHLSIGAAKTYKKEADKKMMVEYENMTIQHA